jgi:hypothetical protein
MVNLVSVSPINVGNSDDDSMTIVELSTFVGNDNVDEYFVDDEDEIDVVSLLPLDDEDVDIVEIVDVDEDDDIADGVGTSVSFGVGTVFVEVVSLIVDVVAKNNNTHRQS